MAAFAGETTLHEAVGNGMLRDALQEVPMPAMAWNLEPVISPLMD